MKNKLTPSWIVLVTTSAMVLSLITTVPTWATESESGQVAHDAAAEQDIPERFRLTEESVRWQRTDIVKFDDFSKSVLTFPSPIVTPHEVNNTVHCEFFEPKGDGPFPAVVVLHILGGDFELSRVCCRAFATSGVSALFLKMPYYGPRRPPNVRVRMISPEPDQTLAGMTQAVQDIRRAVDWLQQRPEIDPQRIGIQGISLGGIVASLTASVEPRFSKGCFVLAGGDLPTMIAQSAEMDDVRAAWAGREITMVEVKNILDPIDPLTYAHRLRNRQCLMFNSTHDEVIPKSCTDALWKAAGEPELVWWNAGHYSAAFKFPSALPRMVRFFDGQVMTRSLP